MGKDAKSGLTRRGFSGLAAGGLAATALTSPVLAHAKGAMPRDTAAPAIDLTLYDARFSAPRQFAAMLRESGVKTRDTSGDIGLLWFAGLKNELGETAKRVAGMGRHNEFWLMQGLAAAKGLKPVFYAEHDFRGRKAFIHRLPHAGGALASSLATGDDWAADVARHLAASKASTRNGVLESVTAKASPAPDHPGLLVSWVFA